MTLLLDGTYCKTDYGTYYRNDGVEFNELNIPDKLIRAVRCEYVDDIIGKGKIRFGNIEIYREWENEILGDANDGLGMYRMDGHEFPTSSSNQIYALCTSFEDITNERLKIIADSNDYDCIITINEPKKFLKRLINEIRKNHNRFHLHCGNVNYNRGSEIDVEQLRDQQFHYNVFQKDASFSDDREYRLSIVDHGSGSTEYVEVIIGDCSDILTCNEFVSC